MPKMRAMQISKPKGPFELVQREIPNPDPRTVRIKVQACGICHSDSLTVEGAFPTIKYPRVPGHEVAGVIDAVGSEVKGWKVGQRVGVGWFGGNCSYCDLCRKGDFINCQNLKITGVTMDGGYADYMIAPMEALALIPDELTAVEAAPLMCAGITTFNALRHAGAKPGDVVAVLGVGGLGHLAIQYASKMGLKTVAIARGKDKEALAKKLGAKVYIDSQSQNPVEELQKLGGAKVLLATATNSDAITQVLNGLSMNGKAIVLGVSNEPIQVLPLTLIGGKRSVMGWPSGSAMDSQETLSFSAQSGVRSMNEEMPLEKAAEAYEKMMSNKARFRIVLTTGL